MKTLFVITICSLAALVMSEMCHHNDDCSHVICDSGYDVTCQAGQCTCNPSHGGGGHGHGSCVTQADCSTQHAHCSSGWHCVDGRCMCRHH
ncbi:serine protease inhibitor Cvsi-2-like [Saccostrea cucullata]|uniref:serine protease inhibitor Cvsi-2-like n=1 Tax=Saccostrea cuccullata TaxID=36930 RepID=UPI002ED29A45